MHCLVIDNTNDDIIINTQHTITVLNSGTRAIPDTNNNPPILIVELQGPFLEFYTWDVDDHINLLPIKYRFDICSNIFQFENQPP